MIAINDGRPSQITYGAGDLLDEVEAYGATVRQLLAAGHTSSVTSALELLAAAREPGIGALGTRTGLTSAERESLQRLATAAAGGVPVGYLTGYVTFLGRRFMVSPDVLVPREHTTAPLVRAAIDEIQQRLEGCPGARLRLLDLGTGSGNVLLSVLAEIPANSVLALGVDRSIVALAIARRNAAALGMSYLHIHWVQADIVSPLRGPIDVIVANLPYIDKLTERLAFEPTTALEGGDDDGFGLYRRMLADLPRVLSPTGICYFEIPPSRADRALKAALQVYPKASLLLDSLGVPRVVVVRQSALSAS